MSSIVTKSPNVSENSPDLTHDDLYLNTSILPECFRCRRQIRTKAFFLCMNYAFHKECFECCVCKKPLQPGEHTLVDRMIYCKINCLPNEEKEFISEEREEKVYGLIDNFIHKNIRVRFQKCTKCQLPLIGTNYIIAFNLLWHKKCFNCSLCDRSLNIADQTVFFANSKIMGPYCKYPCFERKFSKSNF